MDNGAASGTYRTVCARSCDGFYFPISFATVPSRFPDDERTCKALCPASDATLFTYRNPGEDMNQAVSISGQPYSQSPNAFKYRQAFDKSCSCKAVGQTWSDALKNIDDKAAAAQQGDIIVTDESSKRMSQPPKGSACFGTEEIWHGRQRLRTRNRCQPARRQKRPLLRATNRSARSGQRLFRRAKLSLRTPQPSRGLIASPVNDPGQLALFRYRETC